MKIRRKKNSAKINCVILPQEIRLHVCFFFLLLLSFRLLLIASFFLLIFLSSLLFMIRTIFISMEFVIFFLLRHVFHEISVTSFFISLTNDTWVNYLKQLIDSLQLLHWCGNFNKFSLKSFILMMRHTFFFIIHNFYCIQLNDSLFTIEKKNRNNPLSIE